MFDWRRGRVAADSAEKPERKRWYDAEGKHVPRAYRASRPGHRGAKRDLGTERCSPSSEIGLSPTALSIAEEGDSKEELPDDPMVRARKCKSPLPDVVRGGGEGKR